MSSRLEKYNVKVVSAQEAVRRGIKSGDHVVFGHAVAAPEGVSKAMFELRDTLQDVEVFHMLYIAEPWHMRSEMKGHVSVLSNFYDAKTREIKETRQADFLPCHFHEIPTLMKEGLYRVDVAAIQVSYPDENGYCSFGVSCDYTSTATKVAKVKIAEMNKKMPFIKGDNLIHISELDYIIEVDRELRVLPKAKIGEIEEQIGKICAELVPDNATLQLGIGAIPDAVLSYLEDRKDLGIHTEMFTDGVMNMMKKGIITGKKKTLLPNKVVTTLIMGSQELYEFIDNNDSIELYPVDFTNDPFIIGQNENLVSINSCLEIDLMGQVASEAIGSKQFSGTGGQVDFLRGAKRSKGGVSILAFPSTASKGTLSRIVTKLKHGTVVTSGRNEVDYIVTEYGAVKLRGKSLKERAEALISIAHPKFRDELIQYMDEEFN